MEKILSLGEARSEDTKMLSENVSQVTENETGNSVVADTEAIADHQNSHTEQHAQKQLALENVSYLDLCGKSLSALALGFCNQLHTLDICNNQFETLPEGLQGLHSLTILSVSQNKLEELPQWIGNFRNMISLNLASNNLQNLPGSFSNLNLMKELNLSRNQFLKVPDSLQMGCISLQNLDLSHNLIESWLLPPASVPNLQLLCLSYNAISSIPSWLCDGKAMNLISLNLSRNPVFHMKQKLPNKIHKSALQKLTLSHCSVVGNNMDFIGQFKSITHLNLSNNLSKGSYSGENLVREINTSALQFRNCLIQLVLQNVSLVDLPRDIEEFVSLEVLDCRDNQLLLLPDSICNLPQLRVCLLSNNSLCALPNNLGGLTNLRELRIERNNLTCLPESMENLKNLCWLDLYGNFINQLPDQFRKVVDNLQGLDFEFNYVSLCTDLENAEDEVRMPRNKYQSLVAEMRNYWYHVCLPGNDIPGDMRVNGCRLPPVENEQFSSGESSHGESYSYEISESEGDGRISTPAPGGVEEDERWETASSDTDNFDPNDHVCLPKATSEVRRIVSIPVYLTEQHKFCPSDIHMTRIGENTSGNVFAPQEGQFDDA